MKYIAFFEETEFVEKGGIEFPSLRAPFLDMYIEELPVKKSFTLLIAIENIVPNKDYSLQVVIHGPLGPIIPAPGTMNVGSGNRTLLVYEARSFPFAQDGLYLVRVIIDGKEIGEESFNVFLKENNNDGGA